MSQVDNNTSEIEISNDEFLEFIATKTQTLQTMSKHIITHRDQQIGLTRPFFGQIHLDATKIEEVLDAYNAKNNERWHAFRKSVAAMKLFSNVIYICLHIKHGIDSYCLLEIEQDFPKATENVLLLLYNVMLNNAEEFLRCAKGCGIPEITFVEKRSYLENLPKGKLKNNRKRRKVTAPEKHITYLVTKFLNLSEEIQQLDIYKNLDCADYSTCVPDIVSEEKLRWIENKFHNLQSLYDTNISDSNLESVDSNLPVLRGHASLIFHLMEVATELCHYYERHLAGLLQADDKRSRSPITQEELFSVLFDYTLWFSEQYLSAFHDLSQDILKDYSEEGSVELPIPNYRGFHVRPSTLVSRIVIHYGTRILMEFDGERFDASKPLELFRINEKINALKRKSIAHKVCNLEMTDAYLDADEQNNRKLLQKLFLTLLENNDLILYESHFSFSDIELENEETLLELANKVIARYLALGRIDITNNMKVIFHGDIRALNDLKILAESGYGEDNHGNNILLPKELAYLKR